MPSFYLFALSFCFTFASVFLKSFQVKNMVSNQYVLMFFTSMIIGAFEVLAPQVSVKGGPWLMVSGSLGAAFGIIIAVKFHSRLFRPKMRTRTIPMSPRTFRRTAC